MLISYVHTNLFLAEGGGVAFNMKQILNCKTYRYKATCVPIWLAGNKPAAIKTTLVPLTKYRFSKLATTPTVLLHLLQGTGWWEVS
jgi:hypothetical protein